MTKDEAWKALGTVMDPELGYSVVELGMIYDVRIEADKIEVDYSLTAFGCPLAEAIESDIVRSLGQLDSGVPIMPKLVWSPPWGPERMSEAVRLELGYPV